MKLRIKVAYQDVYRITKHISPDIEGRPSRNRSGLTLFSTTRTQNAWRSMQNGEVMMGWQRLTLEIYGRSSTMLEIW